MKGVGGRVQGEGCRFWGERCKVRRLVRVVQGAEFGV